ncbi:MAG: hypothetical protein RSB82_05035 [Victivallaceae bacterium]
MTHSLCSVRLLQFRFHEFLEFLKKKKRIVDKNFEASFHHDYYKLDTGESALKYFITGSLSVRNFLTLLDSLGFISQPFYKSTFLWVKFPIRLSEQNKEKFFSGESEKKIISSLHSVFDDKVTFLSVFNTGFFSDRKNTVNFLKKVKIKHLEQNVQKSIIAGNLLKDYVLRENLILKKRWEQNELRK